MAIVKIRHKSTGTVKDAEEAVADQLIAGGEYEAHVEQKQPEKKQIKGNEKTDDKGGTDAGKSGSGDGA